MRYTGVKRTLALGASILFASLSIHHENVFWISGLSSILSALFLFGSVVLYLMHSHKTGAMRIVLYILAVLSMLLSMFSYDAMVVAPILFCIVAWYTGKKHRFLTFLPLLAIPLYVWARGASGAVPPSGDYGYKLSSLPFNIVGNSFGYFLGTFFGPRFVEYWWVVRDYLRMHRVIAGVSLVPVFFILWKLRKFIVKNTRIMFWLLCGFVSLGAYLGLGNMSERYALVASGFFVTGLAVWLSDKKYWAFVIIGSLIIWNSMEVGRVSRDWQKASDISRESLSIMSKQFFPLRENKSFVFIDTPIRYGRAWIFPTGLSDPLWHVFRFNPFTYTTTNVSSPEAAYSVPAPQAAVPEIFIFENYQLKRLVKVEL
jgi:hypothetical protein